MKLVMTCHNKNEIKQQKLWSTTDTAYITRVLHNVVGN